MDKIRKVQGEIQASIDAKRAVLNDQRSLRAIVDIADCIAGALRHGGKLLVCGNGGSASDALHIAGEIVGRFQKERRALRAVALNADVATMTAIANDYGYEQVFARQVQALMSSGDVLLGISTSGNSENVLRAFEQAHALGGTTVLLAGKDGGSLKAMADFAFVAPCDVTAHIQEVHECVYHIVCGLVEDALS